MAMGDGELKIQKQLNQHRPEQGIYGDCHRTAIACILNMDAADVPHFMDGTSGKGSAPAAYDAAEKWLRDRGLTQVSFAFPGDCPLDLVLDAASKNAAHGMPFILGGESRTGCNHSVVVCNGKIACDPSIDDAGIIGPCDDGFYWITIFASASVIHVDDEDRPHSLQRAVLPADSS